ncbi:trehalose-phosphatase [Sphingomonas fennica]|uniref:Trehalose 6-phosphate phosphatase n=1 Tax=Edaphosphingomonas fennica TaxID=114404 RepID=A0A2T4HLJ6_9SPHN|nr:trehalose-phosphatase [Sphingomonas fennica]PTD16681.1 trehalose-phosphatase [Sphingomonas fennica]
MNPAVDRGPLPQPPRLPEPPAGLLEGASLFIDFDGTLVDLIDRPDEVIADERLRALLMRLHDRPEGGIAVVSGRSIAQLDAMLGPVAQLIALSGSHGTEHRWNGISAHPVRPETLDAAETELRAFAEAHPGVMVESKSFGAALHYRLAPAAEVAARSLARRIGAETGLAVQPGHMMIELRVPGSDKGVAVRGLMGRPPMAGTRPVFIGDDLTDEPGFVAATELGGCGVLVGAPRESAARYGLADSAAVRAWLAGEHA